MPAQAEPPILQVAKYLLPLLVADGSAAAVALTCSSLRSLVHGSQQRVDLSSLSRHDDPDQVVAWAAEAGQHFPACTAVKCALLQESDFVLVQNILPTLARLPALNTLQLSEAVDGALNSPALAMLCSSIGLQLPHLRRLSLHAAHDWTPAGLAWQQLGRITQLTALDIDFSSVGGNEPPFALPDLAALSSLRGLEHLAVVIGARSWLLPPAWQGVLSFLGDLTTLTHLQLPLWAPAGFAGIGRCQKLRCLRLGSDGVSIPHYSLGELCELVPVIGQLTVLTELCWGLKELESAAGFAIAADLWSSPSCCNALKQLKELRVIQTSCWAVRTLDVFVALPHLHTVGGCWLQPTASDSMQVSQLRGRYGPGTQLPTVPQVTSLVAAGGDVPFEAFPNLLTLQLSRAITPAVFAKLSSCTKLRRLGAFSDADRPLLGRLQRMPTLSGSLSERVSAVHALAKAWGLECAAFKASADEEVAALACALKGTPALSELLLAAVVSGQVTCMGVVQVAALRQLRKLSLLLSGTPLSQHGAQMLLCALSHVPEVLLVVRKAGHGTVIEAALEACRALGLALPQSVRLQIAQAG